MRLGVELAGFTQDAMVTGLHVYAAKLHDMRFRQMEGGLPEQFREEEELERQRVVHDDLITRGLSIISDAYLDQAEAACRAAGVSYRRCSREGKNYRELASEANVGDYDLLIMGAMGLGATQAHQIGTVCRRVARRAAVDTLIVKEPGRALSEGPIVVAVDGSPKSYGGLLTGLALARHWQVPVKVVAAFDPYYHYVAFNRIAGVLSEQAGKVFRFKEQEKLHEEIIDSGLARIYQGHLEVAQAIAQEYGQPIETELLSGKPHDAIAKYLRRVQPTLLIIGRLGIHADDELDLGGNAEHLIETSPCALWLSAREHQPAVDVIGAVTTSWTREAESKMERVPSFVRPMARLAILRFAQERGHTVITQKIVEEATAALMPGHAEAAMGEIVAAHQAGELGSTDRAGAAPRWSPDATALLREVEDLAVRGNLSMRAEKRAREEKSATVEAAHLRHFLAAAPHPVAPEPAATPFNWHAAALARLMRVPEGFMREGAKRSIERHAQAQGQTEITLDVAESGLKLARQAMEERMREQEGGAPAAGGKCPFAQRQKQTPGPAGGEGGHGDLA